jgi:hypothetical protein
MKGVVFAFVLCAVVFGADARKQQRALHKAIGDAPFWGCTAQQGNYTINLGGLNNFNATGQVVTASGIVVSSIRTGFCQPTNFTVCNTTGFMEIVSYGQCVATLDAWTAPVTPGPSPNTTSTFTLWNGMTGTTAVVTMECDPAGQKGVATLDGSIINVVPYTYTLSFKALDACSF